MLKTKYNGVPDEEIYSLVVNDGNEEAVWYWLHHRYVKDMKFLVHRYYDSLEYLTDLSCELFIALKGSHQDWKPLRSYFDKPNIIDSNGVERKKSSFRTWLNRVASHLFINQRKKLIYLKGEYVYIDETKNIDKVISPYEDAAPIDKNRDIVFMMEAISKLRNKTYKFILLKELGGYTPEQIMLMLNEQRAECGKNELIIGRIYMMKYLALKQVSEIMKTLKEE